MGCMRGVLSFEEKKKVMKGAGALFCDDRQQGGQEDLLETVYKV